VAAQLFQLHAAGVESRDDANSIVSAPRHEGRRGGRDIGKETALGEVLCTDVTDGEREKNEGEEKALYVGRSPERGPMPLRAE
jgi:hypothetical protein